MTDDMLGPSPMHIKYSYFAYDGTIFLVPLSLSYPSSPVYDRLLNLSCKSVNKVHVILLVEEIMYY